MGAVIRNRMKSGCEKKEGLYFYIRPLRFRTNCPALVLRGMVKQLEIQAILETPFL